MKHSFSINNHMSLIEQKVVKPHNDDFYRYRRPLSFDIFYKKPNNYDNYNNRRTHAIAIQCCMSQWPQFRQLSEKKQDLYIKEIESSCYNFSCLKADENYIIRSWDNDAFICIYNIISTKVQRNLLWDKNKKGSEYLINKITRGEFKNIQNIASMKECELCPQRLKKIEDSINKQKNQKIIKKYSKVHKCFKCKSEKTTERKVYISRAGDEDYTLKVRCEVCFNEWSSVG